jgi:hypothetical protein
MSSAQLFRLSGLALLLGAVTFIVHLGARSLITAGADQIAVAQDSLWVPINALGALGARLRSEHAPTRQARSDEEDEQER